MVFGFVAYVNTLLSPLWSGTKTMIYFITMCKTGPLSRSNMFTALDAQSLRDARTDIFGTV